MIKRKKRSEEFAFGSDSFMDIVANMVGILIILIVIVGLRVRHGAKSTAEKSRTGEAARIEKENEDSAADYAARKADWDREFTRRTAENKRRADEYASAVARQEKELADREQKLRNLRTTDEQQEKQLAERIKENEEREKLFRAYEEEARAIAAQTEAARKELENELARKAEEARREAELAKSVEVTKTQAEKLANVIRDKSDMIARQNETWESLGKKIEELRAQMAKLKPPATSTKKWVHYATPVSQRVEQREIHFRCRNNRVADIHLDALVDRAKDQIFTKQDLSQPIMTGSVGPIGGFRLNYEAQVLYKSTADIINNPNSTRVQLAGWQIHAESEDVGETKEEAMAAGSLFAEQLNSRPAQMYAITLWVYSDSFELARELRQFLHEKGYNVALRPLPLGIPIAGSPMGTASRVQ